MAIIGDTNCINHNAIQCHVIELMRPGSCRIPVDVEQELRVCLRRRSFEAGGDNIVEPVTCRKLMTMILSVTRLLIS